MWNLMCQFQTWFGNDPFLAYGIQLLPLTPISERRDADQWLRQLYPSFAESCQSSDVCTNEGWAGKYQIINCCIIVEWYSNCTTCTQSSHYLKFYFMQFWQVSDIFNLHWIRYLHCLTQHSLRLVAPDIPWATLSGTLHPDLNRLSRMIWMSPLLR